MLKNNTQRKEYLHNNDNWEIVGTLSYHLVFYDMIAEIKFFKNTFCSGIYKKTSDNIYEIFGPIIINNKLFNAIMLQMKELGWLD